MKLISVIELIDIILHRSIKNDYFEIKEFKRKSTLSPYDRIFSPRI
jgi:hypothetical protein